MRDLKAKEICEALKAYSKSPKEEETSAEEDRLKPFEFFYGVIFDQGIQADKAWKAPQELKQRLGHLDPYKIAQMNEEELIKKIFIPGRSLHRYKKMANWLIESSKLLINRYNGNPSKIWDDSPRADDIQRRFAEFKGIAQKKSSMAANILVRDYEIPVRNVDYSGIDIPTDVHVRRGISQYRPC